MSFFESPRFPESISYGSAGGPGYNTTVIRIKSGDEVRNINWTYAQHRYDVAYGIKTAADLEILIAYFHNTQGRGHGYRYKDWLDYKSCVLADTPANDVQIGIGDNSETAFQLIKIYISGSQTQNRNITKPISGTVKIYLDDVFQGSGWSLDTTTGIVTFSAAPGSGVVIKAGYEFDVPCRFDTDQISAVFEDYKTLSTQVPVMEIKV